MLNVIRMELHRLFRTKSLYVTCAVCAGTIVLLITLTAALMVVLSEIDVSSMTVSSGDEYSGMYVSAGNEYSGMYVSAGDVNADFTDPSAVGTAEMETAPPPNPVNFSSSFIGGLCSIFVTIFIAIFIHGFYKDGYSKNVIACVKSRWYFQAAKAVCVAVYTAIILAVASLTSVGLSALCIPSFEFSYMDVFFQYLLGEFFLLNVIGLFSAFLTELTYSKVTSIVYILLASTNLVRGLLSLLEGKLSDIFNRDIQIWKLLPSLYQGSFTLEATDTSGNGKMLVHALVLSLAFIVIYNAAGALLISKRDVK